MNELAFLSIILLSAVRLISFVVSLDFYIETKKRKFKLISLGWLLFFISGLFIIFLYYFNNFFLSELFLILNAILAALSLLFILIGLISYFIKIPLNFIFIYTMIIIFGSIVFWLIFDYRIAIIFSSINLLLIYFSLFFLSIFKRKEFNEFMMRSKKWFYITCIVFFLYIPIIIYSFLQGYSFGLYYTDNDTLVIINYTITTSSTILLILAIIQVEYSISSEQKSQLKDKYSHDLGNALQAIYSCIDLLDFKNSIDKDSNAILEDILRPKLKEASDLIKEIRKL